MKKTTYDLTLHITKKAIATVKESTADKMFHMVISDTAASDKSKIFINVLCTRSLHNKKEFHFLYKIAFKGDPKMSKVGEYFLEHNTTVLVNEDGKSGFAITTTRKLLTENCCNECNDIIELGTKKSADNIISTVHPTITFSKNINSDSSLLGNTDIKVPKEHLRMSIENLKWWSCHIDQSIKNGTFCIVDSMDKSVHYADSTLGLEFIKTKKADLEQGNIIDFANPSCDHNLKLNQEIVKTVCPNKIVVVNLMEKMPDLNIINEPKSIPTAKEILTLGKNPEDIKNSVSEKQDCDPTEFSDPEKKVKIALEVIKKISEMDI